MPASKQREFHLERTGQFYGIVDPLTWVSIRQASEADICKLEAYLAEIKARASCLIDYGGKSHSPLYSSFSTDYLWHLRYGNSHPKKKIIDDKLHRFMWVRDYIVCSVSRYEIRLTLAACNIQDETKKPLISFANGLVESYPSLDFGETSLSLWEDEIHEKVLEMNPAWRGALEGVIRSLIDEHHLGYQSSNIKDWPIESVFSQSANYLYSLLEEINRAVFKGIGRIKEDAWEEEEGKGSAKGFSLYIPKNNWNPNNLGRIGAQENGKFEIRLLVEREKSEYWDTDLRGIIDTLQQAIIWWKECGEYTAEERIQHEDEEKRANLEKEARAYRAETEG